MKKLTLVLMILDAVFMASTRAMADAGVYEPMAHMIADAKAVVVARIDVLEPIERPKDLPQVWYPTHTATLTVTETFRGSVASPFKARIAITSSYNPSAQVGSSVLVFIKGGDPVDRGYENVFVSAQGFLCTADLVAKGDEKLGKQGLKAIKDAVMKYRKLAEKPSPTAWNLLLNDEAVAPLFDLLTSDSPGLRAWAINRALHYIKITPFVSEKMLSALKHSDREVSAAAARYFITCRYPDATEALRQYSKSLPESTWEERKLIRETRCYLASLRIEQSIQVHGGALMTQITPFLTEKHTRTSPISIDVRITKEGGVTATGPSYMSDEIPRFVEDYLRKMDLSSLELLPFSCHILFWAEEGKATQIVYGWPD